MGSLLQPFLLMLIAESQGHGYELMERLDGLGVTGVEPGQVYRVLRGLERDGAVVSAWVTSGTGPARRRYQLTQEGTAALEGWMARLGQLHRVLGACLSRWSGSPSPAVECPAPGRSAPPAPGRERGRPAPVGRRVTSARS